MPHVQVIGTGPLEQLIEPLMGVLEAAPPLVLKIEDVYRSADGRRLILEALVVEGYLRQGFFLLVRRDEEGLIIRCHPTTPVQKTDGVKRLIAKLGQKCAQLFPGSRIGNTNLAAFLDSSSQEVHRDDVPPADP